MTINFTCNVRTGWWLVRLGWNFTRLKVFLLESSLLFNNVPCTLRFSDGTSMCVRRPLTLHNFDIHRPIATILPVMIVEYDPHIVHWYHWHRSKVKVKVSTNMKNTLLVITFEPIIIEISNWYQHFSNSTHYYLDWLHLTLVQWSFQALEVEFFLVTVRFCSNFAHICVGHMRISLSNIKTIEVKLWTWRLFPCQQFGPL
jgi:hypothetical protein